MTDIYNLTNLTTSYSFYDLAFNLNVLSEGLIFITLLLVLGIILYVNYQSTDNIMGLFISCFICTIVAGFGVILGMLSVYIFYGLAVVLTLMTIYVYNMSK